MIQNLYNLYILNNTNLNLSPINADQTVELLSSYIVTATLTVLIVISLVLTFHSKGTAIHKVLGLLLLSIFVVFLWVFQTSFLFIYLVYILAFISAVLMLFLSVVLMLPVSTLSTKTAKMNSSAFLVIPLLGDIDFSYNLLLEVAALLTIFFIWKNYNFSLLWQLLLQWFHLSNYPFRNLEKFEKYQGFIEAEFEKRRVYTNIIKFVESLAPIKSLLVWFDEQEVRNPNMHSSKTATISYVLYNITIRYMLALPIATLMTLSRKLIYEPLAGLVVSVKQIRFNINKLFSKLFDSLIQLYLFINILAIAFSTNFLNITSYKPNKEFSDVTEHVQGLGVLKGLLYDQYGSFLIISTLVLLIALIGAAVMTKNTKSKN